MPVLNSPRSPLSKTTLHANEEESDDSYCTQAYTDECILDNTVHECLLT